MIGSLMMRVSAIIFVVGMLAGIDMGIRENFLLAPAHAHLNLIGGVLLFLFGLYYRLIPEAGMTTLAKVQGWFHIVGAVLFPIGVAECSWRVRRSCLRRLSARLSFWLRCCCSWWSYSVPPVPDFESRLDKSDVRSDRRAD